MAIIKKMKSRSIVPNGKDGMANFVHDAQQMEEATADEAAGEPGQLAVDVFQTADEIVIIAPIAGIKNDDISITITDSVLTIKGERTFNFKTHSSEYFTQECFWGSFSRSIILPEAVDTTGVTASFKNGIVTVRIPKVEKIKTRMVKIKSE